MSAVARIRRRLAGERGFTLVELMTAMAVGMVIIGVAYGLLDSVIRTFGSAEQRVDVSQRGRLAMDTLTQRLRSQVCTGSEPDLITPMISGTPTRVVFWSNLGDANGNGNLEDDTRVRGLEYDAANRRINELVYPGAGTDPNQTPTARQLVANVSAGNGAGLFRYFAYNPQAANRTPPAPPLFIELNTPLTAADAKRVVRITLGFTAFPENSDATDKLAADFTGDFLSRHASSPYEFTAPPEPAVVEPRCR